MQKVVCANANEIVGPVGNLLENGWKVVMATGAPVITANVGYALPYFLVVLEKEDDSKEN